jgi:transposase InsO family protein
VGALGVVVVSGQDLDRDRRGLRRPRRRGPGPRAGAGALALGTVAWRTRLELANALFEYLEIFHNRQRRHSSLGMLTPVEFETRRGSAAPITAA